MKRRVDLPLSFPALGLSQNFGFETQPNGTTVDVKNCRLYDPQTGRARGAQRGGQSRYLNATVNGSNAIQEINHVVSATAASAANEVGARDLYLAAVSGGSIYKVTTSSATGATGGSGVLDSTVPVTFSTALNGLLYFVDGTNYVKWTPGTNTASTWAASSGSLPSSGANTARLICNWRGRMVLSGVVGDPHNWFMSCVLDPENWDYATEAARYPSDMPVAGNLSNAGKIGDPINCLVPYTDQVLLFGGDHAIYQMVGDPAMGGAVFLLTDAIGMAWGRPFCRDPRGVLYFFSSRGGVYRMVPPAGGNFSAEIERLSGDRLEEQLADVDLSDHLVRMAWNDREQGVHLFLTDLAGGASTHYFWDARANGWWKDVYASNSLNPVAVHEFDGDTSGDRVVLLGGQDSYIRKLDKDADDDDTNAIDSYVWLGPYDLNDMDTVLDSIEVVLATGSNDVTLSLFAGNTAEEAYNSTARWSRVIQAGPNKPIRRRARGDSFYLKLANSANNETWSLERMSATVFPGSRTMERVV